jgi:hypothetical protein
MKPDETYSSILKDLANTMLGVARESVAVMKRSNQAQTLSLKRDQEWEVYLEFLRMLFNVVDRLSGFYIPIQDQPEFMNNLEDSVSQQLKTLLAPTLSASEYDDMEVTLAVGKTVSESRQIYEKFRFVITDPSKQRDEYFQYFAERVAGKIGTTGNQELSSAALLCGSAVIPAFQKLFDDAFKKESPEQKAEEPQPTPQSASQATPPLTAEAQGIQIIKLISVLSRVSGEEVETRWGVHPRFQRELQSDEANELAQYMNRVTRILGERFAVIASLAQSSRDQKRVGNA